MSVLCRGDPGGGHQVPVLRGVPGGAGVEEGEVVFQYDLAGDGFSGCGAAGAAADVDQPEVQSADQGDHHRCCPRPVVGIGVFRRSGCTQCDTVLFVSQFPVIVFPVSL